MSIVWAEAVVLAVLAEREGLQTLLVKLADGQEAKAYHYTDVLGAIAAGDRVMLNTTAVELGLGSGGHHFVHEIQSKRFGERPLRQLRGHMMKLRYTPLQRTVLAVEEESSPDHHLFTKEHTLQRCPVLIGELHSMLPIAVCWLQTMRQNVGERALHIVYVMSDGGALPLAYSDHVATLRELQWLQGTVTYGHAYGGDIEALNKFTALLAAKHILKADIIIVVMGPGIAGTGTKLGHTGVEVGELINASAILDGLPIVIPRLSFADPRARHRGISHHTLSALQLIALRKAIVPLPLGIGKEREQTIRAQLQSVLAASGHTIVWTKAPRIEDIRDSLAAYPLPIATMGRQIDDDPAFFQAVCSAAEVAWEQRQSHGQHEWREGDHEHEMRKGER